MDMIARTEAAGRIIDVMTGGNFDWRSRLDESDFLNSADWMTALAYADAALAAAPATPHTPAPAIGVEQATALSALATLRSDLANRMDAACDRTKAHRDGVIVQTRDWYALMKMARDIRRILTTPAPAQPSDVEHLQASVDCWDKHAANQPAAVTFEYGNALRNSANALLRKLQPNTPEKGNARG